MARAPKQTKLLGRDCRVELEQAPSSALASRDVAIPERATWIPAPPCQPAAGAAESPHDRKARGSSHIYVRRAIDTAFHRPRLRGFHAQPDARHDPALGRAPGAARLRHPLARRPCRGAGADAGHHRSAGPGRGTERADKHRLRRLFGAAPPPRPDGEAGGLARPAVGRAADFRRRRRWRVSKRIRRLRRARERTGRATDGIDGGVEAALERRADGI